jgi:hypothetical protein
MRFTASLAIASVLAFAATPVLAQGQNMDNMPGMNMPGMNMQNMLDAGGLKLRVHFPPASLVGIKAGDKITLHLSFTKP